MNRAHRGISLPRGGTSRNPLVCTEDSTESSAVARSLSQIDWSVAQLCARLLAKGYLPTYLPTLLELGTSHPHLRPCLLLVVAPP
jgi:hypothetical protein